MPTLPNLFHVFNLRSTTSMAHQFLRPLDSSQDVNYWTGYRISYLGHLVSNQPTQLSSALYISARFKLVRQLSDLSQHFYVGKQSIFSIVHCWYRAHYKSFSIASNTFFTIEKNPLKRMTSSNWWISQSKITLCRATEPVKMWRENIFFPDSCYS